MNLKYFFALLLYVSMVFGLKAQHYEPTWESIDTRPVAPWFSEAKFGIFIHWGVYSVPAYRPPAEGNWRGNYAEWYGPDVMYKPWRNDSFHIKNYGKDFAYRDFANLFRAELWNPSQWAEMLKNSGARYVVLTTKHSDGFCLWRTSDTVSKGWNAFETGPCRDLVEELTRAVKTHGMKMGFYYSWLEYENMDSTEWPHDPALAAERTGYYIPREVFEKYTIGDKAYVDHCHNQIKELLDRYKPDILWADAAWDRPSDYWRSRELLAWIFNESAVKETIVINDRWDNTGKKHGGYVTTEYGTGTESLENNRPWEECQGMGWSFGYNRAENLEQYQTAKQLIELLVKTVSAGGNLLLNIGPAADGTIPVIMQQRLEEIGKWLGVNGEAIYGTKPFRNPGHHPQSVYFTCKDNSLYAIVTDQSVKMIRLEGIRRQGKPTAILLSNGKKLKTEFHGNTLTLRLPECLTTQDNEVYVIRIEELFNQ
jgi:alpha-L-fucosidase